MHTYATRFVLHAFRSRRAGFLLSVSDNTSRGFYYNSLPMKNYHIKMSKPLRNSSGQHAGSSLDPHTSFSELRGLTRPSRTVFTRPSWYLGVFASSVLCWLYPVQKNNFNNNNINIWMLQEHSKRKEQEESSGCIYTHIYTHIYTYTYNIYIYIYMRCMHICNPLYLYLLCIMLVAFRCIYCISDRSSVQGYGPTPLH